MKFPDLFDTLVPGERAAGFFIGQSMSEVEHQLGTVEWIGQNEPLRDVLATNEGWIGTSRRVGFSDRFLMTYRYGNDVVSLFFESRKLLYRIAVGVGYLGRFRGVGPGDDIMKLSRIFQVEFNSAEDEFLIAEDGKDVTGISFLTDYRASLEHAPVQTIQYISIHDWSLR